MKKLKFKDLFDVYAAQYVNETGERIITYLHTTREKARTDARWWKNKMARPARYVKVRVSVIKVGKRKQN